MPKTIILKPDGGVLDLSIQDPSKQEISAEALFAKRKSSSDIKGFHEVERIEIPATSLETRFTEITEFADFNDVTKNKSHTLRTSKDLRDESFGFIGSENINRTIDYYTDFNSIQTDQLKYKTGVFAEEIEILGGFNLNNIGIIGTDNFNVVDLTKTFFFFDFFLKTLVRVAIANAISLTYESKAEKNVISEYFKNVLLFNNSKNADVKNNSGLNFIVRYLYFLTGVNELVNSDPKTDFYYPLEETINSKLSGITSSNIALYAIELFSKYIDHLLQNLIGASNIEENRLFMIIRKIDKQDYFFYNILQKAKTENSTFSSINNFFASFSLYNFKFFVERMTVGEIIYQRRKNKVRGKNRNDQINRALFNDTAHNSIRLSKKNSFGDEKYTLDSFRSIKSLLKSNLRYSFNTTKNNKDTSMKRLPKELVKEFEEKLESSYMPFYMHDLRTNEILSFHAFIDSITDNFNPEYTSSSGYGRMDDVKHFVKTTRNITVTFNMISYNENDFDNIWYHVNKLVTMVYPQWSDGYKSKNADINRITSNNFRFPYSQVPTASPLIRLRVGDVISSNYSKSNLARLHGIYDIKEDVVKQNQNRQSLLAIQNKSKIKEISLENIYKSSDKTEIRFSDKFYFANILSFETDDDELSKLYKEPIDEEVFKNANDRNVTIIQKKHRNLLLKTLFPDLDEAIYPRVTMRLTKAVSMKTGGTVLPDKIRDVIVVNINNLEFAIEDVKDDNGTLNPTQTTDETTKLVNPFAKSFESTGGKGLAGFITMLDVNYNESTWETEIVGSKAPHNVKITINFSPVHDIPLGLDHMGNIRAPAYNVGSINNKMFGGPYK